MPSLKYEFMPETIFTIVNWASALMMIELGAILIFFKPGSGHEYAKYMTAKKWLSVACITLGMLTVINQLVPANTDSDTWLSAASLCIGALQAILLTTTILSILATMKVTRPYVVRQMLSAMATGLLAILSLTGNRWFGVLFIVIYTIYYICFVIRFINYHKQLRIVHSSIIIERSDDEIFANDDETPIAENKVDLTPNNPKEKLIRREQIEQAIAQWTANKYYTAYDMSVEDVAKQMGCTIQELHCYFREVLGTSFPLWRNQLRVEMAQQLMRDQPSMTVQDIALQSGFNNRSYFYRKFAELTGTTVQEYKNSIHDSSVADSNVASVN